MLFPFILKYAFGTESLETGRNIHRTPLAAYGMRLGRAEKKKESRCVRLQRIYKKGNCAGDGLRNWVSEKLMKPKDRNFVTDGEHSCSRFHIVKRY